MASCSTKPDHEGLIECTLIGCADILTITVDGNIPDGYEVELEFEGKTYNIACDPIDSQDSSPSNYHGYCLEEGVVFLDIAPDKAEVRIIGEGYYVEQQISPIYELSQPNGLECPPICRNGGVTIHLP